MSQPLVSVVMPVRNAERFLRGAIESVLQQAFRDFEFVIVDFGSTDDSKSIISEYAASNNQLSRLEIPNCNLPAARNAGCSVARGDYIAVMDADDVCLPDRFNMEVEFMEKHPEIGMLGASVIVVDGSDRECGRFTHSTTDQEIRSELRDHCTFWHPTVLIRKEAFVEVGGYRTTFTFSHDYDLALRVSEKYTCANLKQAVLKYRIHAHQISIRKQRQQTLCKLGAQASAKIREIGQPDPFDTIREITPALLAAVGMSEREQQSNLVLDCQRWLRNLMLVGDSSSALQAALDCLHSDLQYVDRRHIADLYLTIARLYWKRGEYWSGGLASSHAAALQPRLIGPLLGRAFRKLGIF